jgi:hypothetical protein
MKILMIGIETKQTVHMKTMEKTMTTQEVADRFFELAQEGKFDLIVDELFDDNIRSLEPAGTFLKDVQGLDKVKEKGVQWQAMIEEMHDGYTNKPQVAGNYFVCIMGIDVTLKGEPRKKIDEVALYEVRDGKIVLEQFFF